MFLWRSLHHGDFPRPIWIGSRRFWRESAVLAWIAEREVAPPPTSRRPGRKAA
ncbi:MAG: AlpA family phage regulatory protein [Alphaproteobacteria bacterium]|nr:AlpA family phage regulatory protein [Alphaproteobacteria bacterium]